jgi:hypothetical protein
MNNKLYDIVFVSTFIDRKNIDHLIWTVVDNNQILSIFFIIINQTKSELILPSSTLIDFHQINTERLSLSKARNIGINYLMQNNIHFEHIMFPDDDTTFSDIFFNRYKDYISSNENYLIDVYCFGSNNLFKPLKHIEGEFLNKKNFDAAMSVNMIISYKTLMQVGIFDERLGVGADYGAGEDGDYYIRCCNYATKFIYTKQLFNYHPASKDLFRTLTLKQIINRYNSYGRGVVFMLCKHHLYGEALIVCIRAIGGAIKSIFTFDLKLFCAYIITFISRLRMLTFCYFRKNHFKTKR